MTLRVSKAQLSLLEANLARAGDPSGAPRELACRKNVLEQQIQDYHWRGLSARGSKWAPSHSPAPVC